jgi:predicted phosphodiesterase
MKTSGLFTIHSQTIPAQFGKPIRLVFFGDVHWDSPNHAKTKWKEALKYFKTLKNSWFLGMGDYLDSTSTSERECLGNISPRMHETFRKDIEALQLAKCEAFSKEIEFMKNRLVGLINGNHYFDFKTGINSDQKIAEMLDTTYLGACAFIRLTFKIGNQYVTRDIFAHHGAGGSRLIGGSINRVAQMAEGAEADIYVMGHDHKRVASPAQVRLFLSHSSRKGLMLEQREPVVIRSGSYLASYEDGVINYNVDACRPPSSLGHVEVIITVRDVRRNGVRSIETEMRSLV